MTGEPSSIRSVTQKTSLWSLKDAHGGLADYIDVSAVSSEDLSIHSAARLPIERLPSRARKVVRSGDTIFATIRPGLRRIAMVPPHLDGALASTAFCVLRPNRDKVDPLYLFFAVSSEPFVQSVAELQTGASYPAVRDGDVLDRELPFPDPADQESIGKSLDAVWRAVLNEAGAVSEAAALKRAAMGELFTRGLRGEGQKETEIGLIPATWNVVALGKVGRIGNGSTPKRSAREYWDGGTFPWLTSAKVYDREIVAADQFVTETALAECHLPKVRSGSVLMAITGQGKTLGHCAVLRCEATVNQHVAYIEVSPKIAEPSYVRGYLETQYDYLRQVGSGGGSTKGALTCAFLKTLPIPLPPDPDLDEQREIVEILDAIDQKIDLHKRKKAVLEELFKALLRKLMTGEIRVTDLDLSALDTPAPAEARP